MRIMLKKAASATEVLQVVLVAPAVGVPAKPAQSDVELAPAGADRLHALDAFRGEEPRVVGPSVVEVDREEAGGIADRADQPAVSGTINTEGPEREEAPLVSGD